MKTYAHLDWVAVTFPHQEGYGSLMPAAVYCAPFREARGGRHGYSRMLANENGAQILMNGTVAQGIHFILPGQALLAVRAEGVIDKELAAYIAAHHGRASRVDLAVNILDGKMTIKDLREAWSRGEAKTEARKATQVTGLSDQGDTLYIGSGLSNRYFRAYNKAAQVNDSEAWIRLELECKRVLAAATLQAIAISADTRAYINAAIVDFVDFPTLPEFQQATRDRNAEIPHMVRKMTKTYRWLIETIAPCLARYEVEHPKEDIERAFLTAWDIARKEWSKRNDLTP